MSSSTRSRLSWQVILAATVLAALAAVATYVVLDDGDDAPAPLTTEGTLGLTPLDEGPGAEPLDVAVTWPDGSELALSRVIEGPTVVNFFASWCPPCIAEMPDFESVSQAMAGDVAFLGLAVQDRPEDAARIVEETGVTYRWARDVKGDVAAAAEVTQMPSTMFVDADGDIVSIHSGALDADELRALIESELGVPAT